MPSILPPATQQLFDKQIAALPLAFRDALGAFDWQGAIAKVGAKYRLTPDQNTQFIIEIGMVLVGLADPTQCMAEIQKRLAVSADVTQRMGEDLKTQVFDPLQAIVLRDNRGYIESLQQQVAKLEHDMGNASLQEVGIEITDEAPVAGTTATAMMNRVPSSTSSMSSQNSSSYTGHDPYHEPLE